VPEYSENYIKGKQNWQRRLQYDEMRQITAVGTELHLLKKPPNEGWILKTLGAAKQQYRLKECRKLGLVGSGFYPYSLLGCWNKQPEIEYHGFDRDSKCALVSQILVRKLNIDNMFFHNVNGETHNYEIFDNEDMLFIGCDVDNIQEIYQQMIISSKAQVYLCLPHKKALVK